MKEVRLKKYGTDILIVGEGMTQERFATVKATLPADDRRKVIGWRRVGTIKGF